MPSTPATPGTPNTPRTPKTPSGPDFELHAVFCPACGAPLSIEGALASGASEVRCEYCNAVVRIRSRMTSPDGTTPVTDPSSGQTVAHVRLPFGWSVKSGGTDYSKPTNLPFRVIFEARDGSGAIIKYRSGEKYTHAPRALATQMTQFNPDVHIREFLDAPSFVDAYAKHYVGSAGTMEFLGECEIPLYEPLDRASGTERVRQQAERDIAKVQSSSGTRIALQGLYFDGTCRMYRVHMNNGQVIMLAVSARVEALKTGMAGVAGMMGGLGMGGLAGGGFGGTGFGGLAGGGFGGGGLGGLAGGGLFGRKDAAKERQPKGDSVGGKIVDALCDSGLLGGIGGRYIKSKREKAKAERGEETGAAGATGTDARSANSSDAAVGQRRESGSGGIGGGEASGTGPRVSAQELAAFKNVSGYQTVDWHARDIIVLQAPPESFEAALAGAYVDVCSTARMDKAVIQKLELIDDQRDADIARRTQQNIAQQQRQFQAWQQINATQQAAFDSYNQAWWDRENSSWAHSRASYQAQMDAQDRTSDMFSEAMRGVNTYIRPDGTEVEVSVASDRAWVNGVGDVIGTSAGTEPGYGWTEMNRKY